MYVSFPTYGSDVTLKARAENGSSVAGRRESSCSVRGSMPCTGGTSSGLGRMPGRPLGAEQSNTSLVYGDAYIMKIYRRLTDSPNPDLEVVRSRLRRTSSPRP